MDPGRWTLAVFMLSEIHKTVNFWCYGMYFGTADVHECHLLSIWNWWQKHAAKNANCRCLVGYINLRMADNWVTFVTICKLPWIVPVHINNLLIFKTIHVFVFDVYYQIVHTVRIRHYMYIYNENNAIVLYVLLS